MGLHRALAQGSPFQAGAPRVQVLSLEACRVARTRRERRSESRRALGRSHAWATTVLLGRSSNQLFIVLFVRLFVKWQPVFPPRTRIRIVLPLSICSVLRLLRGAPADFVRPQVRSIPSELGSSSPLRLRITGPRGANCIFVLLGCLWEPYKGRMGET